MTNVQFCNEYQLVLLDQSKRHRSEFLERGFYAVDDFGGQLGGRRQAVGVGRVGVLPPEQVEVALLALRQILVAVIRLNRSLSCRSWRWRMAP